MTTVRVNHRAEGDETDCLDAPLLCVGEIQYLAVLRVNSPLQTEASRTLLADLGGIVHERELAEVEAGKSS